MNNAFSIVYAKQGAPELRELIELRSVAALPFAGRYRMIDVLLSNLTNSGIRTVGLITQRNYASLIDHVGSGKEWDLSRKVGGLMMLPPYDLSTGEELYRGLCDALFDKRDFIEHQRQPFCLLMATDQVYRQDFNDMMAYHVESGADITVLYARNERLMSDASGQTTFFEVGEGGRITDIMAEPTNNEGCYANMRVSLMDKSLLLRLVEDACAEGRYDLDMGLIKPALGDLKVMGFEHKGYVGRVNSVKSYFDLNQDMLDKDIRYEMFDPNFPVYTKTMDAPPSRFARGCDIEHSLFGNGCDIRGHVRNSIVFRGVRIDEAADVENCLIMQNTHVGAGAKLRNMIIDKDVVIGSGARCISVPYDPGIVRKRAVVEGDAR